MVIYEESPAYAFLDEATPTLAPGLVVKVPVKVASETPDIWGGQ